MKAESAIKRLTNAGYSVKQHEMGSTLAENDNQAITFNTHEGMTNGKFHVESKDSGIVLSFKSLNKAIA